MGSERKFFTFFDASPASISVSSLDDKRYLEINKAFEEMWGYGRDEVVGRPVVDVGIWPSTEQREYVTQQLRSNGKVSDLECRFVTKTGQERTTLSWAWLIELEGKPCMIFVAVDITERIKVDEALRLANAYNRSLIESSPDPLIMINLEGRIMDVNTATEEITGVSREKLLGTDFSEYFTRPEEGEAAYREVFQNGVVRDYPLDIRHRDGRVASVLYNASIYWDEDGEVVGALSAVRDITERRQAERRLLESEERYRTAIEHSNDGVVIAREGDLVFVNRKFLEMLGYENPEDILGSALNKVVHPDDSDMVGENIRKRQGGEPVPSRYEFRGIRKDGTIIFIEVSVAGIIHHGEPASLAYLRDITERKLMEEKLRAISIVDELTGLYNRRGFLTLSEEQIKLAKRTKQGLSLFFIDLDRMKWINDTLGHQKGDEALIGVATILRRTFRDSDIVGRMGGDEFAVLAINAVNEKRDVPVRRLRDAVDTFNRSEDRPYKLSLSVGVSNYDPRSQPASLDELIAKADTLMYREKKTKRR